jgi:hypothetical protein
LEGAWSLQTWDSLTVYLRVDNVIESTQYSLHISHEAHDRYGNYLPEDYHGHFRSEEFGVERIIYSYPQYDLFGNLYIPFNAKLDTNTVRDAFRITPLINYELFFSYSLRSVTFQPAEEFLPRTTYTVTIDTTLKSINGTPLPKKYVLAFTTPDFKISSTFPRDNDTGVSRWRDIDINFTSRLDTATVRTSFRIEPAVKGEFMMWRSNSIYFRLVDSLLTRQTYTVTIDTSVHSVGGLTLASPYTFSFTTRK